jgi:exopolyphosphatase/guanosine-5'-triphosphate,3'-diphosphate pyrophosphatase
MKIAAIDIGTTSVHIVVVQVRPDFSFEVLDREKEMVRLGAGGLEGRPLTETAMRTALQTLGKFNRLAQSHSVDEVRSVATSAVREAPNGGEFLAEVERQTGIRTRVITGIEEARLVHQAALYGVEVGEGTAVVVDIGGGSTEITLGTRRKVELARSFKLGTIRLTERFVKSDPLSPKDERRLVKHIRSQVGPFLDELAGAGFDRVIGTSGTIMNVGTVALAANDGRTADAEGMHHRTLPAQWISRARKQIVALDLDRRLSLPGLDPRRADLIVAGAILLDTIVRRLGAAEVTLCDYALREGLVLDFVERHRAQIARADQYPDIRRRSVMELAERCNYRTAHAEQVAKLALSLFDQTTAVHTLSARAREWLEYAAVLHDVGRHISFDRHQRHSYYLIKNGGLRGFDPDEVEAIALIARHHRRAEPRKSDGQFAALPGPIRRAVRVGASLLRVAEHLDRSHAQVVDRVEIEERGDAWTLGVHARADAELEVWATSRHLGPLAKVLGKPVHVETRGVAHAQHTERASSVPGQALRRRGHRRLGQDDAARPAR